MKMFKIFTKQIALIYLLLTFALVAKGQEIVRDEFFNSNFYILGNDGVLSSSIAYNECIKINKYYAIADMVNLETSIILRDKRTYQCKIIEKKADTNRPSSFEQKIIQTRRFKKSEDSVAAAIDQWAKDNGWVGSAFTYTSSLLKGGDKAYEKKVALSLENNKYIISTFDLDIELIPKGEQISDVRIRTYVQVNGARTEFFSKKRYQELFNEFAQQLFVEAIQLEPSDMN